MPGGGKLRAETYPKERMGLGLGGFGADAEGRLGEYLAAGGAAAYLPTDGTNMADYLVAAGGYVPEVQVLYGLSCEGRFSHFMRFEPKAAGEPTGLGELAAACLERAGGGAVGLVALAETAGLIGAALKRPPGEGMFAFPQVREWLSFSAEGLHRRGLALVVGVAARGECGELEPLLRGGELKTHFHAAPFAYRPLAKGVLELGAAVAGLFEREGPQGVLHLLNDDREIEGAGESEFVRGACWFARIGGVE